MFPRWLCLTGLFPALLLALCPLAARSAENSTAPARTPSVHVIEGLGKGTVDLDGAWQFHTGDDPAWASPSFDDSDWKQLGGDKTWGQQGFPSHAGYAWYRFHFSITPVAGAPKDWALLIPQIDDAYELYLNGTLVGRNGSLPPSPTWYISQPPQTYGLGPTQSGVLAIRAWKAPLSSNDPSTVGGFEGSPVLGGPEAIATRNEQEGFQWLRSNQVEFGLNLLYALIGLFSLLAWGRDRKQWLLLCMAGYALSQVAATILGGLLIPWPFSIAIGVLQPVLMIQDVSLWYLLLLLLKLDDKPRLMRLTRVWVIVFCLAFGLDGLTTALWGTGWSVGLQIIDAILTVIFTPLETLPIVLVVAAVMHRKRLDFRTLDGCYFRLHRGNDLCSSQRILAVYPLHALDPEGEAECAALCLPRQSHDAARSGQYLPARLDRLCPLPLLN